MDKFLAFTLKSNGILNMLKNQSSDIKSVILIEKKGESQEYFSVISSNTLKRRIEQICATRTF